LKIAIWALICSGEYFLLESKKRTRVKRRLGQDIEKRYTLYKLKLLNPEVLKTEIAQERQRLLEMKIV
jgi:hypothetical protein